MLKYLRDKNIIRLHLLELVGMTEKDVKDSFINENGFPMGTVTWNVGHDEAKINEIDNELNKLIYGKTPTNVNSDESFESEESPEEISENEIVEAEDNKSLNSNELRTESGRKIEEAPRSELIVRADGTTALGYIDSQTAEAIGGPSGKIEANIGAIIHTQERGHGQEILNAGYPDLLTFLQDVLDNWTEIKEGSNNSFWLVRHLEDKHGSIAVIKLDTDNQQENVYKVNTMMYLRERSFRNKKTLYTRHPAIVNSSGSDVNLTIAAPSKSGEHTTKGEYLSEEQSFKKILHLNNENVNARTSWPKNTSSVDTQSLVEFFNTANESSGFHELAHHVLRVLTDAVQLENSSDILIEDVKKIFRNAGVKYDDFINNIGKSRETAHEYFAKSFEAYLFEGKAPVQELQSTFDRIKQWLVGIYHDIQKISGIELNDEMRDIFDRLLASPEQAAEQKNISEINSLYEAGENELQKLQEQINQLETEINAEEQDVNSQDWVTELAYLQGLKEGKITAREQEKLKAKKSIEKLKQNFKLIQERQKERRNIREKYKKLVKEINRMSEAKNIHWNRLQQIKNLLSTYDNLNQKNYSLKEMQDIHSQVQELFNVGKRELAAKKLADKERIEAAKQALMKNMITEWNNRPKGAIRNRDDNAKQYNGVQGTGRRILDWATANTFGAQSF